MRAKANRDKTDREPTSNDSTNTSNTGPTLSQGKGDQLLKQIFFSGHPLPTVLEPDDGDSDLENRDQDPEKQ